MSKERLGRCLAPPEARSPNHREYAQSIHHITPRSIAKIYGWSHKQTNAPENKMPVCDPCHQRFDYQTPLRGQILKMQQAGVVFSFAEHQALFKTDPQRSP